MSDTVTILRHTPFPATAWTEIEAAKGDGEAAQKALKSLCAAYWAPAFGVILRRVRDPEEAKDLTQKFFARLLERGTLIDKADRRRGRFRSFLSRRLQWFVLDHFKKERAKGPTVELNDQHEELMIQPDLVEDPEFDYEWAKRVFYLAMDQVESQYRAEGRERRRQVFIKLRAQLRPSEIAAALKLDADTVKNELRAIREDSEKSLVRVVRATVTDDSFMNEELAEIRRLFSMKGDLERGRFVPPQPGKELEKQNPHETE